MTFAARDLWAFLLDLNREPDHIAEILRDVTFPGEGFGCYSTFDVREDAERWSNERLADFWRELGYGPVDDDPDDWGDTPEQLAQWGQGYTFPLDCYLIDVAWFWDGDGTLVFTVRDGEKVLRRVQNTDCKKAYRWYDLVETAA